MKAHYLVLLLVTYVSAHAADNVDIDDSENINDELADSESSIEITDDAEEDQTDIGHKNSKKIAFSAYLSADKMLAKDQHLKFDKVLLNDGNAYDVGTGVFRANVCGVYVFTYVVAHRHVGQIKAKLVYDGKVVNGAVAEGRHKYHDSQGTNTAIIHVCKGKSVWVEAAKSGKVEGNTADYRYTSFSGFLLYEQ